MEYGLHTQAAYRLVKSEEEASSPPIFELSRSFPNWAPPVSADGVVYGVEGAVGEKQTPETNRTSATDASPKCPVTDRYNCKTIKSRYSGQQGSS